MLVLLFPSAPLLAAGSGLNVLVVVNQASSNSVALGNLYCERRQVPPQNVLRIDWPGANTEWTRAQFETILAAPLRAAVAERGLAGQVDFVALSLDIPFLVKDNTGANSTTSALFYGFKTNDPNVTGVCSLPRWTTNFYANTESPFRLVGPGAGSNTFLATLLTAYDFAQATRLVQQGVDGDSSFPTQTVLLAKTTDPARTVRYWEFDNAVFNTRLAGRPLLVRTNSNQTDGLSDLFGMQTGLANYDFRTNTFLPGAIADTLTSYAGVLFGPNSQTPCLEFIRAGASGSYGTVVEPCNYLAKFPDPQLYFVQARGFSLAECYYQSLVSPYMGVIVGEPLSAAFAQRGEAAWVKLPPGARFTGTTNLAVVFTASDTAHPLQQVDLFLDGTLAFTVTNILPEAGNVLSVRLNDHRVSFTVPANATLQSLAVALADRLNLVSNTTKVTAAAVGDRIELQSLDLTQPGSAVSVSVSNAVGSAGALTASVRAARSNFLDSVAHGVRLLTVRKTPRVGDWLRLELTKTNGATISLAVTNLDTNGTLSQLTGTLLAMVNGHADLQGSDGVVAEDFASSESSGVSECEFILRARSPGWNEAQILSVFKGSLWFSFPQSATNRLDENLSDLRPRNHLFLTAGAIHLTVGFPLATTALADGWHELTAVAYEGSHVRTQTRATLPALIGNTPLAATLTTSASLGVAALSDTLLFGVAANTNAIATVELLSTGGSLGVVSNQADTEFAVAAAHLGAGLHPFCAVVADSSGHRYRTETKWIRISDAPAVPWFAVSLGLNPIRLRWPSVAGHSYDVLSSEEATNPFAVRTTLSATNTGLLEWTEPDPNVTTRFYRVRIVP